MPLPVPVDRAESRTGEWRLFPCRNAPQSFWWHGLEICPVFALNAAMFRSRALAEIDRLDPIRDHQRIVFLTCRVDFPWDTTRALEFALFRSFAVPSIAALLHKTREFETAPQKRYDDTDIIVSEIMEHGYDSDRGRAGIARMNAMHDQFPIRNDDFLYVLSTFVFEPIRWNARFGWRRMTEKERLAMFHFWRAVGQRMNIREIPTDYAGFEQFSAEYERANYRHTEASHRVGAATRELFKGWFPRWARPVVERGIHAFMDDELLEAFGFQKPSRIMRFAVETGLRLRGHALRFWPRRREPLLRTEMIHPTYPDGYVIEKLGPATTKEASPRCPHSQLRDGRGGIERQGGCVPQVRDQGLRRGD